MTIVGEGYHIRCVVIGARKQWSIRLCEDKLRKAASGTWTCELTAYRSFDQDQTYVEILVTQVTGPHDMLWELESGVNVNRKLDVCIKED
jgi:hypothetical protein